MVPLGKDGVDVGRRQLVAGQHLLQAAAAQVAGQVPLGALQDAQAGQAPGHRHLAVVAAEPAAHLDRLGLVAAREAPQVVGFLVLAQHDAAVAQQVVRRVRPAVLVQVARRGAHQAAVGRDLAGDQAPVGQVAEADGQVDAVAHEIGAAVGQLQLYLDAGMAAVEQRDGRRDVAAPEAQRRVHLQQAARLGLPAGDQAVQFVEIAEDAARVLQVELAFGGQADAARAAPQQPHAQPALQLRQPLADGRRRHAQLARRAGHAARAHQLDHQRQFVRMAHPGSCRQCLGSRKFMPIRPPRPTVASAAPAWRCGARRNRPGARCRCGRSNSGRTGC